MITRSTIISIIIELFLSLKERNSLLVDGGGSAQQYAFQTSLSSIVFRSDPPILSDKRSRYGTENTSSSGYEKSSTKHWIGTRKEMKFWKKTDTA